MPRYIPTGLDRDSHISGIRPKGRTYGEFHDVEKRRDNLPSNIVDRLKEEVINEERRRLCEENARSQVRVAMAAGKGGKKVVSVVNEQARASETAQAAARIAERHAALASLYEREEQEWEAALHKNQLEPLWSYKQPI